jgi:hypothetical protein
MPTSKEATINNFSIVGSHVIITLLTQEFFHHLFKLHKTKANGMDCTFQRILMDF